MPAFSEIKASRYAVTSFTADYIEVGGRRFRSSLLILPDRLDPSWGPSRFTDLTEKHLTHLAALRAEGVHLILLGTGLRQHFPPAALLRSLTEAAISVEVMDTAAACRTHNILLAEGRLFASALILEKA